MESTSRKRTKIISANEIKGEFMSVSEIEHDSEDGLLADAIEAELLCLEETSSIRANEDTAKETPQQNTDTVSNSITELSESSSHSFQSDNFGKVPQELFGHILKFLSPEDLASTAKVCHFLKQQSSEDSLWRRGYCLRWGPPQIRVKSIGWKQMYFERDKVDMHEFLRNCPEEFRDCYIQMQAARRSHAPRPDQVNDDLVVLESATAQQVSTWRCKRGLPEVYSGSHDCSGQKCSFHRIHNVFLCDETGRAHVCDEGCTEMLLDPEDQLLVCTISGRCSDPLLYPDEEEGGEKLVGAVGEDGEQFFGAGRFGRAFCVGYNCDDEKELRAAQRFMGF